MEIHNLLLAGVLTFSSVSSGCSLPLYVSQYSTVRPETHGLRGLHEFAQQYESIRPGIVGIKMRSGTSNKSPYQLHQCEITFEENESGTEFDLAVAVNNDWTRFYGTLEEGVTSGFTARFLGYGQFDREEFEAREVHERLDLRVKYDSAVIMLRQAARTGNADPLYPSEKLTISILGKKIW
jgi:hypothetical protein